MTDALLTIAAFVILAAFGGWVGALVAIRRTRVEFLCVHDPECRHDRRKEERAN